MDKRLGLALSGAVCIGIWAAWPVPRVEPRATSGGEQERAADETLRAVETRLARVDAVKQWSAPVVAPPQPTAAETAAAPPPASPAAPPKSSSELETEYEQRFREDQVDTRSSRDASQQLADALARAELTGSSLQSVRCGRSLCRMEVRHEDARAKQRFSDDYPTAVPWHTTGLIRFVDEHTSLVYLATPEP
ncbi:MAG TPA: hypothetical protein VJV78_26455 [Polyangiales bacterium]|nr:hypothetical protein [Polyangiales bacterium]